MCNQVASSSWHTYPKIYALGHAALKELYNGPVIIQEKIDGSQFSFGVFDGELRCRSKGKDQYPAPDEMFNKAIEVVESLKDRLTPGWTYRGEYLASSHHNVLCYDRHPKNHIILFDINIGHEEYLNYRDVQVEATRLGLEAVATFAYGVRDGLSITELDGLLEHESFLGNTLIEGVVIKNYFQFGTDKKVLMGKFVSEKFKEKHDKDWKGKPTGKDICQRLVEIYGTEARWVKAVQHLQERGELKGSPQDIGNLLKEIQIDLKEEYGEEIKNILFNHFWKVIGRGVCRGVPEWYKRLLVEAAIPDPESQL